MATHVNFMGNQRPRAMDAHDIRQLLGWQKEAARKARRAGFDILYVYAGMGYLPYEFLLPEWNQRTDEYGGSVANRVRIVRQLLEVTHEAAGGECAVALRISLEELRARPSAVAESEAHEVVQLLSEVPDLWDVKLDSSPTDCSPSRFSAEGSHEPIIEFVKKITRKPVVGVGRFTSPDTMVGQIRRGVLDLIGGGAALHRRPVPAAQDQRGPRAGHPRVHRLQHLHLQLARRRAGALHAEPDHRRGVAPRLAPGAHRARRQQRLGPHRRRRPCRSRMRALPRAPRLRGERRRGRRGHRRPPALRDAAARTCASGAACSTGAAGSWRSSAT